MPRDLFGDVTRPSISIGSRKWYTLPVSLLSHSFAVGLLIALPILAPSLLPEVWRGDVVAYLTDVIPPAAPPPPIRPDVPVQPPSNPNAAPIDAPTGIAKEPEVQPGFEPTIVDGNPGLIPGDLDHRVFEPPSPVAPPEPVHIGGSIRAPQKMRDVLPLYPHIAQAARVQGIVILEATIGVDGQVLNARILRSVPLLDQAALDAVRQWQFTPTLLNGVPVPVVMTVTVAFQLR